MNTASLATWLFCDTEAVPRSGIEIRDKSLLFQEVGRLSSEWWRLERSMTIIYEALFSLDGSVERVALARATMLNRSFHLKVELLEVGIGILFRQSTEYRDGVIDMLKSANSLSRHRNAILHGVVDHYEESGRDYGFVLCADPFANLPRIFPRKRGESEFRQYQIEIYDLKAISAVVEATHILANELFHSHPAFSEQLAARESRIE